MSIKQWDSPPKMQIDETKNYSVSILTNRGTIELELYPQHAPQTVTTSISAASWNPMSRLCDSF